MNARRPLSCAGPGAWSGPCGCDDCLACHPSSAAVDDLDDVDPFDTRFDDLADDTVDEDGEGWIGIDPFAERAP